MNKVIVKEGLYSSRFHTYMHITSNGDIIDCLPKSYKHILKVEQENTNLKQALIDIREYVNGMKHLENWIDIDGYAKREKDILQIINKFLGGSDE